jgi:hypothetical protein
MLTKHGAQPKIPKRPGLCSILQMAVKDVHCRDFIAGVGLPQSTSG